MKRKPYAVRDHFIERFELPHFRQQRIDFVIGLAGSVTHSSTRPRRARSREYDRSVHSPTAKSVQSGGDFGSRFQEPSSRSVGS